MTTQPEALLNRFHQNDGLWTTADQILAAAELRRLHEANQELLVALKVMLRDYAAAHDIGDVEMQPAIYQARAAIARAEGRA